MNMELGGPSKSSYKFNEVTSLTGVKPYVLRFWETEFEHIHPTTNEHGQKIYSQTDIEAIQKVKKLLFDDKLTIPQAKGYLDRDMMELDTVIDTSSSEAAVEFQFEEMVEEKEEEVEQLPPPLIPIPSASFETAMDLGHEDRMAIKTAELKIALDAIIERNSLAAKENSEIIKATPAPVIDVKKKLVTQRLSDRDIVNLVSAKKKLGVVLGRIDNILSTLN